MVFLFAAIRIPPMNHLKIPRSRTNALASERCFFIGHAERQEKNRENYNFCGFFCGPHVPSKIDEDRRPGQWVLSGSQSFPLMQGVSQSLSGRVAVLSLLPLSWSESQGRGDRDYSLDALLSRLFSEYVDSKKKESIEVSLHDWVLRGAYPEIRANPEVDRQIWCSSYIQTYLERDVRQVLNVGDLNVFNRFLRLCASRTGQILNLSELARDVGLSVPTAKKVLSVLEASYQVFLLPPHFKNFGKRIIKSPKLYFLDTAIATFLLGLHEPEATLKGPMIGQLFENAVVSEWVKAFLHRGEQPELYYWRSKTGIEVDLIIDRNGRLYPIEVKASSTLLPPHTGSMNKWRALAGNTAAQGIVVAPVSLRFILKECKAVPWNEMLG
jgi:predicted AAA+ superfamily ATPase